MTASDDAEVARLLAALAARRARRERQRVESAPELAPRLREHEQHLVDIPGLSRMLRLPVALVEAAAADRDEASPLRGAAFPRHIATDDGVVAWRTDELLELEPAQWSALRTTLWRYAIRIGLMVTMGPFQPFVAATRADLDAQLARRRERSQAAGDHADRLVRFVRSRHRRLHATPAAHRIPDLPRS